MVRDKKTNNNSKAMNKPALSKRYWRRKTATHMADLIREAVKPVCRHRGFAGTDIITYWAEIVGQEYAMVTEPEKIRWPRQTGDGLSQPGTLVVRCDGAHALFFEHEAGRICERVNRYFGYPAIDRIQILQRPLSMVPRPKTIINRPLHIDEAAHLEAVLENCPESPLRDKLRKLGAGVLVRNVMTRDKR